MRSFDFEEERIRQEILRLDAKRVFIQLPEGLKPEAPRLAKVVEEAGALPIVSADPCYGACDLATEEGGILGADLLIHYGHSKMMKYEKIPTLYAEARATLGITEATRKALSLIGKWQKIGLVTTVQHIQTLDEVREILVRSGKIVEVGDARRLIYPGQITGCDYSNAKSVANEVEAFLFIGGGRFHALGVALTTSKPTVVADPYECNAFSIDLEAETLRRRRWGVIQEASKAESFGILIGLKLGQTRLEEAILLKAKLEKTGKRVLLLAAGEITPQALVEFPAIQAYVDTACPRVAIDDAPRFKKPILTTRETLVVVGELSWEELCKTGLIEN